MTVRRLLRQRDYSLRANRKEFTGPAHPERDRQFRYIERVKRLFFSQGYPVIRRRYQKEGTDWELQEPRCVSGAQTTKRRSMSTISATML